MAPSHLLMIGVVESRIQAFLVWYLIPVFFSVLLQRECFEERVFTGKEFTAKVFRHRHCAGASEEQRLAAL